MPRNRLRFAVAGLQLKKQLVLDMLHCERFVDKSPAEIWTTLLDEEIFPMV